MTALAPAFADPVTDAQATFRTVMNAMARPGMVMPLACDLSPPSPFSPAAAAVALALLDYETPFWLDRPLAESPAVTQWLSFHTGAPQVEDPGKAAFAFVADVANAPAFDRFALGSLEYPDGSSTLVMQVEQLSNLPSMRLTGPGMAGTRNFSVDPLPENFLAQIEQNRASFPRGIDLVFVTADGIAALPRSTRVESGG
jgi:alpha-D-ribose 1-methylphosphonate 5-triphosphate synthase subunit PhnH